MFENVYGMPEGTFRKEMESIDKWIQELRSLGISARKTNSLNDSKELGDLTNNIKETMYQDYKTAYTE
ncbi:MAG TPA: hypothetical protein VJL54_02660 [Nitrososphaera sp.]|jgi:hypothetical protein|nr:hypothetical protein [Nitrososphaera sp.]